MVAAGDMQSTRPLAHPGRPAHESAIIVINFRMTSLMEAYPELTPESQMSDVVMFCTRHSHVNHSPVSSLHGPTSYVDVF